MVEAHGNWIDGERRPAREGADFELSGPTLGGGLALGGILDNPPGKSPRLALSGRALGSWPRSGAGDVEIALAAARTASSSWWALGATARRAVLARVSDALAADPDPEGLLAARLGLDPTELAVHFSSLPQALAEALERGRRDPHQVFADHRIAGEGLLLYVPSWAELVTAPAVALFSALLIGRTVLVLSDARAPMIADALAAAGERGGLPPGTLSVLHGDGDDALRAALASGVPGYVLASGFPERAAQLERLARGAAAPSLRSGLQSVFGSGLQSVTAPAVEVRRLHCRSALVRSTDDPAERAAAIVEGAFGRSTSLSGQLPLQIARAISHERSFSRFTEELLAALSRSPDVARPVPLLDRESEDLMRRARVLGLDEGATLIFDGNLDPSVPTGVPAADRRADPDPRSPVPGADAMLSPTVFTNVEERMRLARLRRPAPLLCLLRVENDDRAAAMAERLDHGPRAYDLPLEDLE